ncbi:MAG: esterase/lipase superfamily enzyme [Verrucomicrobiales bacterium]|jgi:esterase/lipase superfamily enzyme
MSPTLLALAVRADGAEIEVDWADRALRFRPAAADLLTSPFSTGDPFEIDLRPLLAEIQFGLIADHEAFETAEEFRLFRDLLNDSDFHDLTDELFTFLWRAARDQTFERFEIKTVETGKVWADPDRRLVRVWFGTNREIAARSTNGQVGFEGNGSTSGEALHYGVCQVFIPESHKPGSVGTPWWRRWIQLGTADDSLDVRQTRELPGEVFWEGMAGKLRTWWEPGERNVFVLIHGYNVSFEDAAKRAAQIGYDLKLPGEIAFFSWPSCGTIPGYAADEATIEASFPAMTRFLHELSERSGAERIHLFVHSMGNRGFLRALERVVSQQMPALRLGQVFFCAPDVDPRTFGDSVEKFAPESENRTLLVSPEDKAVWLSSQIRQLDRVGLAPPVQTFAGLETIEVRGFGLLELGHGYFAEAGPVIEDIREAIETRKPASERKLPRDFGGGHFRIDLE